MLCLACALLLAAPTAATGAMKSIWGPVALNGESAFPTYERLGVDVLQLGLNWASVAQERPARPRDPNDPAYTWPSHLEFAVEEGGRHGVEILLRVGQTPGWANGGKGVNWAPDRESDFADFLTAASRHFRGVRLWVIWGEPSRRIQFNPMPPNKPTGPRRYARLLDAAYVALKRQSRRNRVIGGNTFTYGDVKPRDFVRWMRLPNGKPPRLDWFGHNPFSARSPKLSKDPVTPDSRDLSDIDTLRADLRRAYRRTGRVPRLWLSEWTIQSSTGSDQFKVYVSERTQAKWIRQAYAMVNRLPYVAGLGWYKLNDERGPGDYVRRWGLITLDGRRKPSYHAFRNAPSDRFRPRVEARRAVSASTARRGFTVRVRTRTSGRVTAWLQRGSRRVSRSSRSAARNRTVSMRMKATLGRGRYVLHVRASRATPVRMAIRVR